MLDLRNRSIRVTSLNILTPQIHPTLQSCRNGTLAWREASTVISGAVSDQCDVSTF